MKKQLNCKIFYQQGEVLRLNVLAASIINLFAITIFVTAILVGAASGIHVSGIRAFIFLLPLVCFDLLMAAATVLNLHKIKIDRETICEMRFQKVVAACKIEDIEYISIKKVGKLSNVYIHSKDIKIYGKCNHLHNSYRKPKENVMEFLCRDDTITTLREFYLGPIIDKQRTKEEL